MQFQTKLTISDGGFVANPNSLPLTAIWRKQIIVRADVNFCLAIYLWRKFRSNGERNGLMIASISENPTSALRKSEAYGQQIVDLAALTGWNVGHLQVSGTL